MKRVSNKTMNHQKDLTLKYHNPLKHLQTLPSTGDISLLQPSGRLMPPARRTVVMIARDPWTMATPSRPNWFPRENNIPTEPTKIQNITTKKAMNRFYYKQQPKNVLVFSTINRLHCLF